MRRNATSSMGALHPALFFLFIYGISLFLAIFVCRTVYYSMNDDSSSVKQEESIQQASNSRMDVAALK
ncbi:MAG TPA: hypothetical protein VFR58_14425 [Flavisolibacter sp.]|nr:hypothetical protein [Flavisolibacter sp.]